MKEEKKDNKTSDVAKREEEILKFWEENKIFQKSEEKDSKKGEFIFYDGPPFATGLPHYGHILAGTIKDVFPRYKTMRGFRVRRKWGWDCHGLPLENIIEEKLGLKTKRDIEEIGIETFNEAARNEVLRYADEWETIVKRMGRWVHMHDDYKTMDAAYTESVWWAFSELDRKGLVTEGFKSMHLCPRCGTTLSNFEVAQGYADIKDFSVTVKLELEGEKNTYLLVWTTTPWTLPGNMAAAVHKDETYVSAELESGEIVILGKKRVEEVLKDKAHNIVREFKGKDLIGKSYKPPFSYYKNEKLENKENIWKVWHAPYVSEEEGTGLVHLAPAFGADDMELAQMHNFPMVHHVGKDGKFIDKVADFKGLSVKPKDDKKNGIDHTDTDVEIIKKLAHEGILFAKEKIEHSYPHCWRCDTPLLNYAASSWFVTVPDIKKKLISENKKIGWVPADIREGRFGKWLEGVRDWAISRSRYWGAPIPVWKTDKGEAVIIGSVEDLKKYIPKSGNIYYGIRHGESVSNAQNIISSVRENDHPLTSKGREEVLKSTKTLKKKNIDLIIASPLVRTKETAEIVAGEFGLNFKDIIFDDRIAEINLGDLNLKSVEAYQKFESTYNGRFDKRPSGDGAESLTDVRQRMGRFIEDAEQKYKNKNILIVSHEYSLWMLDAIAHGWERKQTIEEKCGKDDYIKTGEVATFDVSLFPYNKNYELDLHRPYIDEIHLEKDGEKLTRVPDVFDCWFESGSMPYAQHNYKGEALNDFNPRKGKGYPADFIAEAMDQTRGWFYSMLVLGVALFGKSPYKNVVVSGLVLAEDGKKMSKRLNNYPDPIDIANKYGVDALRYYMLSSPIMHGEDLNFSEKGVQEVMRKNIGRLNNVLSFYNLYKDEVKHGPESTSGHILDKWILTRLNEIIKGVTASMEKYELDRATRPIGEFIDDLSTWYLRRSRERFKGDDEKDKKDALRTTKFILREISKIMAPFMPFYAEYLYKQVCDNSEKESVHLDEWPKGGKVDEKLLTAMSFVQSYINIGLQMRDEKEIKVRQPLAQFVVKHNFSEPKYWKEIKFLIEDELNVREVILESNDDKDSPGIYLFDWKLTPELIKEGLVREALREVQAIRKNKKLIPGEMFDGVITVRGSRNTTEAIQEKTDFIKKEASLSKLNVVEDEKLDESVVEVSDT